MVETMRLYLANLNYASFCSMLMPIIHRNRSLNCVIVNILFLLSLELGPIPKCLMERIHYKFFTELLVFRFFFTLA